MVRQWLVEALHLDQTQTALTTAVASQNPQCVRPLLNKGANPKLWNGDGSTPLMTSADTHCYGDPEGTQDYVNEPEMREPTVAAANNDLKSIHLLIAHGANVNLGVMVAPRSSRLRMTTY